MFRASELLLAITPAKREQLPSQPSTNYTSVTELNAERGATAAASSASVPSATSVYLQPRHKDAPTARHDIAQIRAAQQQLESREQDTIAMAQNLMDNKEYSRAVHWLKLCESDKAVFLKVYSMYLVSTVPPVPLQTFHDNQVQRRARKMQ